MRIFDLLPPVLARAEGGDIVHRTGPIERHQRDDVFKAGGLHRRKRAAHAFGFQLEHAHRLAALKQLIDLWVIPGQRRQIEADPALGKQVHRALKDGNRLQRSEEKTSEIQALMRNSYDVFCLTKKNKLKCNTYNEIQ